MQYQTCHQYTCVILEKRKITSFFLKKHLQNFKLYIAINLLHFFSSKNEARTPAIKVACVFKIFKNQSCFTVAQQIYQINKLYMYSYQFSAVFIHTVCTISLSSLSTNGVRSHSHAPTLLFVWACCRRAYKTLYDELIARQHFNKCALKIINL